MVAGIVGVVNGARGIFGSGKTGKKVKRGAPTFGKTDLTRQKKDYASG